MSRKTFGFFIIGFAVALHAEVKFDVPRVVDDRGNAAFPGSLEIFVNVDGPELATCKGLRFSLDKATDNTGKVLNIPPRLRPGPGTGKDFLLREAWLKDDLDRPAKSLMLKIENPARTAKRVDLSGHLELLAPANDPQNVITNEVGKVLGKPIVHDSLKAAKIQVTFVSVVHREITFDTLDPAQKIGSIEFCDAKGKLLKTSSWSTASFTEQTTNKVTLEAKAPAGLIAKIILANENSVLRIPFSFGVRMP